MKLLFRPAEGGAVDLKHGEVLFDIRKTSWGWIGAGLTPDGVAAVVLPLPTPGEASEKIRSLTAVKVVRSAREVERVLSDIELYLSGAIRDLKHPIDFGNATDFQVRVWEAARRVPYGQTRTYGWLSREISGRVSASRAVGQALGKNPVPLLVPCHRITAAGGLGGFTGGLEMKRKLLRLEGTQLVDPEEIGVN